MEKADPAGQAVRYRVGMVKRIAHATERSVVPANRRVVDVSRFKEQAAKQPSQSERDRVKALLESRARLA